MARKERLHVFPGQVVLREGKKSVLPVHGKNKELGTGLVNSIKKQLGLK